MADESISQAAIEIGPFEWTAGDPVSLAWSVTADWHGTYQAEVRKAHTPTALKLGQFTVTATYDGTLTHFTMQIPEVDSVPIPPGTYYTDVQQVGGVTRVWAKVKVLAQVTVLV